MNDTDWLARQFEEHREHLRQVAYRMLGSRTGADDAVQETWLRLSRSDVDSIDNLGGWLTTVVSRVCLDVLRNRASRREEPLSTNVPDPILSPADGVDPADASLMSDAVGLALLVVLDTLAPPERIAFVLHDMFGVPFDDIAPIVGRSATATRQLASRGRRRVQGERTTPDVDTDRQRQVVDAFFAASRDGNFDDLVAVLDPEVVVRSDGGEKRASVTAIIRGAETVARQAMTYARLSPFVRPVLVNGVAGVVVAPGGQPFSVMAFTVQHDQVVAIDALVDPDRLARLDLARFQ